LKGDIPVVPFPYKLDKVPMKVDVSRPRYALLEVILVPVSQKVKSQIFFIELRKFGSRWLVTSWVPRGRIAVPATLNE